MAVHSATTTLRKSPRPEKTCMVRACSVDRVDGLTSFVDSLLVRNLRLKLCKEDIGLESLVAMLMDHVKYMYAENARNFLILDVPAVNRSPVSKLLADYANQLDGYISEWNELLHDSAREFTETESYSDASLFLFSSHKMLSDLLDDAEEFGFIEGEEAKPDGKIWIRCADGVAFSKTVHRLLAEKMALAISLVEEE
ncbi:uncharacterized protein B0H18DRAFT_991881 [Fomitopsis serialis]|uniref:uncharacterized protein n=1 Tax=Fomitopsis serialis TaxID=139415 RepID=UPI0020085103|nr:uncharacterized protein B0H18DRAFT_991881 [Neoantrodia serialis]KAH9930923.1 hypothetical protein B0H18DRAFT_991881 [Neoantrodia serialis]